MGRVMVVHEEVPNGKKVITEKKIKQVKRERQDEK